MPGRRDRAGRREPAYCRSSHTVWGSPKGPSVRPKAARPETGRAAFWLVGASGDGLDAGGGAGGVDVAGGRPRDADAGDNTAVKGDGQAAGKDVEARDVNRS